MTAGGPRRSGSTLSEVARLAGVSEITVSRVVRNHATVAEDTRARVQSAIRTLDYVPNRLAGTLASAGSNLVGVILPSMANSVFPEVLAGVSAALAASGHQPVIGISNYDLEEEERLVRSLLAWKPAALLVAGLVHTPAARRSMAASGIRIAEMMEIGAEPIDVAVGLSHPAAGRATAAHLLSRGYRRFAYVGHDWERDRRARLRHDGLASALAAAGHPLAATLLHPGPSSAAAGRALAAEALAATPRPDVLVFSNDDMAVGGAFHLLAAGIAPRTEVGLFGFNGLDIGEALPFPLSTVRSNRYAIGRRAAEAVIAAPRRPPRREIVDTGFEIVEGATA